MADKDVILSKLESLKNYIERIESKKPENAEKLSKDYDLQDIISVNIERAVQLMVGAGLHILSYDFNTRPGDMASIFENLAQESIISEDLAGRLKKAVGFRNISVHEYQRIDWNIVFSIADKNIDDFRKYIDMILVYIETMK